VRGTAKGGCALTDDLEGGAGWLLLSLGVRNEIAHELEALLDTLPVAAPA
jgi:hypothetical protein